MYADDVVIHLSGKTAGAASTQLSYHLKSVAASFEKSHLTLHVKKT